MPSTPTTRKRSLPYYKGTARTYVYDKGAASVPPSVISDVTNEYKVAGTQTTVSEGHPWPPPKGMAKTKDIGGDFLTIKNVFVEPGSPNNGESGLHEYEINDRGSRIIRYYWGPLLPKNPLASLFPVSTGSSDSTLDALGTTAIARCKPTNPVADLGVALGELRNEGLPKILGAAAWEKRLRDIRKLGDEFLNVQFGWLPLIGDVKDSAKAISKASELLAQYQRDSGRNVRRKYRFPVERSVSVTETSDATTRIPWSASPITVGHFSNTSGTLVRSRETVIERWFSGCFTYHLPDENDNSFSGQMHEAHAKAKKLFGLSITPDVLWNLAPWSWAVDWFSNTGDVISNVTSWATDGLVMRYGYIMEKTTITDSYTLKGIVSKSDGPLLPQCSLTTIVKKRRHATPFGFGLELDGLSGRQQAIIAALGLSRL